MCGCGLNWGWVCKNSLQRSYYVSQNTIAGRLGLFVFDHPQHHVSSLRWGCGLDWGWGWS